MQTIHLEPRLVPPQLCAGYTGKKFRAEVTEHVTIPSDAGVWGGGSRTTYRIVRVSDGASIAGSDNMSAPWSDARTDKRVTLEPGIAVVSHSIFCGKDMGLTFYVHPTDAAPMLPAPVDLSPVARLVLKYTAERKSSYNGQDRYSMALSDARYSTTMPDPFPTREQWDAAKLSLIAGGFLNKAGAITPLGRNSYKGG